MERIGGVRAVDFLKLVLEPDRLAVVGLVACGPTTIDELAQRTGQRPKAILTTLAPLVGAGVVEREGDVYRLRREGLRELAQDLPQPPPPDREVLKGLTHAEQAVLAPFFQGKRLLQIPAQRAKRLVLLERLALEFEPGRRYDEREVNGVLALWYPDYASLRRYLVDERFLDRAGGEYWRSGGRVLD